MLQVAILPCKPKDIFTFLSPLFEECKLLEQNGISVDCEDGTYFAIGSPSTSLR